MKIWKIEERAEKRYVNCYLGIFANLDANNVHVSRFYHANHVTESLI